MKYLHSETDIYFICSVHLVETFLQTANIFHSISNALIHTVLSMNIWYRTYRKGTSIREVTVFRHLRALRKSPWKFIIWMNEL